MSRMLQPWYWWDWLYYLLPAGKRYKSVLNILHGFTKEVYKNANNMYLKWHQSFTKFFMLFRLKKFYSQQAQ